MSKLVYILTKCYAFTISIGTKKKKLTGIAKLDDANFAGGAKGKNCTLILTEGGKFQD